MLLCINFNIHFRSSRNSHYITGNVTQGFNGFFNTGGNFYVIPYDMKLMCTTCNLF